MSKRDLLEENKDKIISEYLSGMNTVEISKEYGCSNAYIWIFLKNNGVTIRDTKPGFTRKEEILTLHSQGLTCYEIARKLSLPDITVNRTIKRQGLKVNGEQRKREDPLKNHAEEIIKMYEGGEGCYIISNRFNCGETSIIKLLRKNGIKIRKLRDYSYDVDEHFFDIIDTQEKAYCLGLWMADGCNMNHIPCVAIALTDEELVIKVAKVIQWKGPIEKNIKKNPKHLPQYAIRIGSRIMSDALVKVGCPRGKTYIADFPDISIVPANLHRHLIRGWFDGDGTITANYIKNKWHVRIVGTEKACIGIAKCITEHICIYCGAYPVYKGPKHTTWGITISGNDKVEKFVKWIYEDSTISLDRKYNKAQDFLKSISSSSL